jgi:hypothetical protein
MKPKNIITALGCLFTAVCSNSQSRLILNGATVTISGGAYLVIDNPATNALTRNSGHIVSEGENNRIKWNVGTVAGTYTIPFGYSATYLPVTLTKGAGTGSGALVFSTYHTGWKNSDYLPTGVTNMLGQAPDHSAWALDRFWQVSAEGYATKPAVTNLTFTYLDAEHQASGNNIMEPYLAAQQWNGAMNKWDDAQGGGFTNTSSNTVSVASVPATGFYKWWVLTDQLFPLPVKLLNFSAVAVNKDALLNWATASEGATKSFLLQRSRSGNIFEDVIAVDAKGSGGSAQYQYKDTAAYKRTSFYRIKTVGRSGSVSYSDVRRVFIEEEHLNFSIYPNPVINKECTVQLKAALPKAAVLFLMDKKGAVVASYSVPAAQQKLALHLPTSLPAGVYLLKLLLAEGTQQQQHVVVY